MISYNVHINEINSLSADDLLLDCATCVIVQ